MLCCVQPEDSPGVVVPQSPLQLHGIFHHFCIGLKKQLLLLLLLFLLRRHAQHEHDMEEGIVRSSQQCWPPDQVQEHLSREDDADGHDAKHAAAVVWSRDAAQRHVVRVILLHRLVAVHEGLKGCCCATPVPHEKEILQQTASRFGEEGVYVKVQRLHVTLPVDCSLVGLCGVHCCRVLSLLLLLSLRLPSYPGHDSIPLSGQPCTQVAPDAGICGNHGCCIGQQHGLIWRGTHQQHPVHVHVLPCALAVQRLLHLPSCGHPQRRSRFYMTTPCISSCSVIRLASCCSQASICQGRQILLLLPKAQRRDWQSVCERYAGAAALLLPRAACLQPRRAAPCSMHPAGPTPWLHACGSGFQASRWHAGSRAQASVASAWP